MPFHTAIILLPCHSLEDLPTHFRGGDADSLLANWTAAWHPALISTIGKQPQYADAHSPCHSPGEPDSGTLFLVPSISLSSLPDDFTSETNHSSVVMDESNRDEIVRQILAFEQTGYHVPDLDSEQDLSAIVGDFYALGYAFLQIQLMTRQIRGSSNLDTDRFEKHLVEAATALVNGDREATMGGLTSCFDLLMEEKNTYYPVQPELIDLVLTAPSTLGESLMTELDNSRHSKSLLITGSLSRQIETHQPATFELLKTLIQSDKISLVGGVNCELAEPLLSIETTINQIDLATTQFQGQFGIVPTVYARRRSGLSPSLPTVLDQFNFSGAMHCSMDGGAVPASSTRNIRWESEDGSAIPALAQDPQDANEASTFLRLGVWIGQALDSAHLANVILAHWPNRTHDCFHDLCRISHFGPLFGEFRTLDDYFDAVYDPGYGESYSADEYRGEYLKSSVANDEPNPISRFVDYWQRHYLFRSLSALLVVRAIASPERASEFEACWQQLTRLQSRIELATETDDGLLDADIGQLQDLIEFNEDSEFRVVFNATSFSRSVFLQTENRNCFNKPTKASTREPVRMADSAGDLSEFLVDVPAMSATQLNLNSGSSHCLAREANIVEGHFLRNEFFEVEIDSSTGGIRRIDKYDRRKNLLSQQLALRTPSVSDAQSQTSTHARYSQMRCTQFESCSHTRLSGQIMTSGYLVDVVDGKENVVGQFQQTFSVTRGMPRIDVNVTIESQIELTQNANHYFCSRIAWKHESDELVRSVQESRVHVIEDRFEAPNFIQIKGPTDSITLLTGGLPYHRRTSRRTLDSLLLVRGENKCSFRFGIGLNLVQPVQSAADFMTPPQVVDSRQASGWFFHFSCKNVMATAWQPIFDPERGLTGVEIRIRETENRGGQLVISCPHPLSSARRVNFLGEHLQSVDSHENTATVDFHAAEFFQIQLNWNP